MHPIRRGLPTLSTVRMVSGFMTDEDGVRRRERIEGPKRWAADHLELLEMIWAKFDADDDWPDAKMLQRELFAAGRDFDVD